MHRCVDPWACRWHRTAVRAHCRIITGCDLFSDLRGRTCWIPSLEDRDGTRSHPRVVGDRPSSNIYARLTDDGLTQWHPVFLTLGETLAACSARYRAFCARYQPTAKHHQPSRWGSRWLPQVARRRNALPYAEQPLLPGCGCQVTEPLFPPALARLPGVVQAGQWTIGGSIGLARQAPLPDSPVPGTLV